MKASIDELRRVAADMLRQGGDEVGAAVLAEGADWAATMLKHKKTVEACLKDGPTSYSYAESNECAFCGEWQTGAHKKGCEWVLMMFELEPEKTMVMVHEHALSRNRDWDRMRPRRNMTATEGALRLQAGVHSPIVIHQSGRDEGLALCGDVDSGPLLGDVTCPQCLRILFPTADAESQETQSPGPRQQP